MATSPSPASLSSGATNRPTTNPTGGEARAGLRRDVREMNPVEDFVEYARAFARERPDLAALWCFGIGFVVGWKLKPW